jgi:hypothetical protein
MFCTENDVSNNSSIVACILWRQKLSTEPLPSNDMGIHIQSHRLMGGIYEERHWDGQKCRDTHTKLVEISSGSQKCIGTDTHTNTQMHRQRGNTISLYSFPRIK